MKKIVLLFLFTLTFGKLWAYQVIPDTISIGNVRVSIHPSAKPIFENNPTLTEQAAFRNSSMQGGYLITAVRALGFDCGAMSGFDADAVNAAFFPEGDCKANFLLNIGVADPAGVYPRNPRLNFEDAVKIL